jgi:class 3 adenylate cyclase
MPSASNPPSAASVENAPEPPLRPWQRLGLRLAALFAAVTVLAVGVVGTWIYDRQRREVEETLGIQLFNIARVGALLVDPGLAMEARRAPGGDAPTRLGRALAAMQREAFLFKPVLFLTDYDAGRHEARVAATSAPGARAGEAYRVAPEIREIFRWTVEDGVARATPIYRNDGGTWITAFAPVLMPDGASVGTLVVDYPVDFYLDRLRELRRAVIQGALAGGLLSLVVGLLFARHLTRPLAVLTRGVARVADGDLSRPVPVSSRDEIGRLTEAFNAMLAGLRQRDFIRDTFGRYVSPEVAREILESPEGLRLGGEKRVITVLMSDLRGYTRFAEQGDPAWVMDVLNGYLARMTDLIVEHGGTVNEFMGDGIVAVFGAPVAHPDHAERAAAAALAMQRAMVDINASHAARGLPRFEMGIGLNTGEAVVGNIGSEQRAKYAVVGAAVNLAARVESATVGGQIFMSAGTHARIRDLTEVADSLSVELKGLLEPLTLYELVSIRGRFAQQLPSSAGEEASVAIALPLACRVLDGKVISQEIIPGVVVRLGPHQVEARLGRPLSVLTNVRFRLQYPGLGVESGDLYGKVVAGSDGDEAVHRIRLTSVDATDQKIIEDLLADAAPSL